MGWLEMSSLRGGPHRSTLSTHCGGHDDSNQKGKRARALKMCIVGEGGRELNLRRGSEWVADLRREERARAVRERGVSAWGDHARGERRQKKVDAQSPSWGKPSRPATRPS